MFRQDIKPENKLGKINKLKIKEITSAMMTNSIWDKSINK
jgi:hypothetical protein